MRCTEMDGQYPMSDETDKVIQYMSTRSVPLTARNISESLNLRRKTVKAILRTEVALGAAQMILRSPLNGRRRRPIYKVT